MKDLIAGLAAIVGFVGMRGAALSWWFLKIFVALCILFGAYTEIFQGYTLSNYRGLSLWDALWAALTDLGGIVADNWAATALVLIFIWVLSMSRSIKRLATDVTHAKLAAVTTLSYLDLEVETEGMKEVKEVGLWQTLKNAAEANFWGGVLGMRDELIDDAVTAKATRLGRKVRLQDDIPDWMNPRSD